MVRRFARVVLGWMASVSAAFADPGALRAPTGSGAYVAEWGVPSMSAGAWLSDQFAVGADFRQPGASFGLSAGTRKLHAKRVGVDGYLAGGLAFPLRDAGLGLTVTPAARVGVRGKRGEAGVGLAIPVAVGLAGGGAGARVRAPILVEPAFGLAMGPVRLGVTLSGGPVLLAGAPMGVELGARVALGVAEPAKRKKPDAEEGRPTLLPGDDESTLEEGTAPPEPKPVESEEPEEPGVDDDDGLEDDAD